jgi:PKD repeat protein
MRVKKKLFLLTMVLLMAIQGKAQNEANNWIFGNRAGINFSDADPTIVTATTSSIIQFEGVANYSDPITGELLFYTDGVFIWDEDHTQVVSSLNGSNSATQSCIIVPDVSNPAQYYIFTLDAIAGNNGLQYVIYNHVTRRLTQNSELLARNVTEKLTAVKKGDDSGYWVLAHDWLNANFLVYEVNCDGVISHAAQVAGAIHGGNIGSTAGYMKFNQQGTRIALAVKGGNKINNTEGFGFVQVFNFDNINGLINANPTNIVSIGLNDLGTESDGSTLFSPYGLEFSQNSDFLYIAELGNRAGGTRKIFQYEFSSENLNSIGTITNPTRYCTGALQIGRDGRIYVATYKRNYLGLIRNPEVVIPNNFIDFSHTSNQFPLIATALSELGLPNFVSSIFEDVSIDVVGQSCSPTFSYSGLGNIVSYLWNFGDGTISTSEAPIHTYLESGTYTVTLVATTNTGCSFTFTTEVIVENCCPILTGATNVIYHDSSETITSDIYWSGKHYIPENVIITVADGASLDITNVDVIFGECAGIVFEGSASGNINNSVLRPCDLQKTWRGIYLEPDNSGIVMPSINVNESTFQNAQVGIYSKGILSTTLTWVDINLTNNLFINNQIAIYIRSSVFVQGISGNTITVDNPTLFQETTCSGLTIPERRLGIYLMDVRSTGFISQNDFICTKVDSSLLLYGVSLGASSGNISSNNFSNNHTAIEALLGSMITIEANEIEISADFYEYASQIIIRDVDDVHIKGNTIVNAKEGDIDFVRQIESGIEVSSTANVIWIGENEISGFNNGISLMSTKNAVIVNNELKNNSTYGIYLSGLVSSTISCNKIDMLYSDTDATGIGYFQFQSGDNKIYSNCILETNQAIHVENLGNSSVDMPDVKNNYLYNYSRAGIENIGMEGSVGVSGVNQSEAGRNSFIANNWPNQDGTTTGDVISTVDISQNGNYGVGIYSTNVTGNANAGSFHSTANCATQNRWGNNYPNEMDDVAICDKKSIDISHIIINVGGVDEIIPGSIEVIEDLNVAVKVISRIMKTNPDILHDAIEQLKSVSLLSENEKLVLEFTHLMHLAKYESAKLVAGIETEGLISNRDKFLVEMLINNKSWLELSEAEKDEMFEDSNVYSATHIFNVKTFGVNDFELNIFPVPTRAELMILLNSPSENPLVEIHDINGKLIEAHSLQSKNTVLKLQVEHLSNGLYFVVVKENDVVRHGKFIKE